MATLKNRLNALERAVKLPQHPITKCVGDMSDEELLAIIAANGVEIDFSTLSDDALQEIIAQG